MRKRRPPSGTCATLKSWSARSCTRTRLPTSTTRCEHVNRSSEPCSARFKAKEDRYRGRNKRIDNLVIRSARKYNKVQCTQSNSFTPAFYPPEYLCYGIATPGGGPGVICDHYEPLSTLFSADGSTLKPGWKVLDYSTKLSEQPPVPITVYVKFGTFD